MNEGRRYSEQERLSLALSSAEMGTWDWDIHTGVMWWDEGMHALFGLAPGTFKGSYEDFLGLIHREYRERIRGEFACAITARTAVDTEFRVSRPSDGSAHVVRIRSRVYNGENSKNLQIVGVAWDITERRQTELALARERNLLATLMENLPSYIYFKDLDCRFIAASRAMAEVHGRKDPAELIGLTDRDLFSSGGRLGRRTRNNPHWQTNRRLRGKRDVARSRRHLGFDDQDAAARCAGQSHRNLRHFA